MSIFLCTVSMTGGEKLKEVINRVYSYDYSKNPKEILDRSLLVWQNEREILKDFFISSFPDEGTSNKSPFIRNIGSGQERLLNDCGKSIILSNEAKEYLELLKYTLKNNDDKTLSLVILFFLDMIEIFFLNKLNEYLKTPPALSEDIFFLKDLFKHRKFFEERIDTISGRLPYIIPEKYENSIGKSEILKIFRLVRAKLASINSFTV